MDDDTQDRARGALFGNAIGDALGVGAEFMTRDDIAHHYPDGLNDYADIVRDAFRSVWLPGEWTDDTDQMLCILDSLLEHGSVQPADIARRIHRWAADDGRGIGRTTATVVGHPGYLDQPEDVAHAVWQASGGTLAPNGGVMRTAVLGVWHWRSTAAVVADASRVCRLTHADPRCVASCVAVSLAVARLVAGASVDDAVGAAAMAGEGAWPGFGRWLDGVLQGPLDALELDDVETIGFTLKTAGAGFWALAHARSVGTGLRRVIHEGGDADTNAAVAGALLGARDGLSAIPARWVRGLHHGAALHERADRLLAMIGARPT